MRKILFLFVMFLFFSPWGASQPMASVDWQIGKTFQLKEIPDDFAISRSGKWTFILTRSGDILIYDALGDMRHRAHVGAHIDKILAGPRDDMLLLSSQKNKTVQMIYFRIPEKINTLGAPFAGAPKAPVEIVVFSDFQCPYCARNASVLRQVLENNPEKVKIVFKNYPLRNHEFAGKAAVAALAAQENGKFWQFHDRLFEKYNTLSDQVILSIAQELGFTKEEFEQKIKNPELRQRVRNDMKDARKAGIRGVPAVFINGKPIKDRSLEAIQFEINKEMKNQQP